MSVLRSLFVLIDDWLNRFDDTAQPLVDPIIKSCIKGLIVGLLPAVSELGH